MSQGRNRRKGLGGMIAAIAGALAFAPSAQSIPVNHDAFNISGSFLSGTLDACMFTASNELSQFFNGSCTTLPKPVTAQGGIVVLLEPPGEPPGEISIITGVLKDALVTIGLPSNANVSDVFAMSTIAPCSVCIAFVSDGAPPLQLQTLATAIVNGSFPGRFMSLPESGHLQDVSSFFGQDPGVVQVGSDVPEPSTWLLMGTVLASLSLVRLRRKNAEITLSKTNS